MSGIIVVGSQWGDEGKGKVVDLFSSEAEYVVRYQGGANAGHTLIVEGQKTVLHLIPSGILRDGITCVVAAGVVLDVEIVANEIKALKANGFLKKSNQLKIADSCTVILPYHRKLDQAREKAAGNEKIGTTGKGIGPAYEDRASRKAVLFRDLFDPQTLRSKLEVAMKEKNYLIDFFGEQALDIDEVMEHAREYAAELEPYRCEDVSLLVNSALDQGKRVLFEGAQGTLLDLLHGTYPFVTSSATTAGSACIGIGVGPTRIEKVVGITKAYATRVGSGPFPTELKDETGEHLQKEGHEFGSTTGRTRRCGWLDLVALRYATRINGITNIALMKLDVLSKLDEIGVAMSYRVGGEEVTELPTSAEKLAYAEPVIKKLPGWKADITGILDYNDLPKEAQQYIEFISDELKLPIDVISVGPGREQTIWRAPLF
jgi:adenylosuccinate synthase